MDKIFISLEKEVFKGNVLDFTYNNESIIYNANKFYDNYIEVDYVEQEINNRSDVHNIYDSCVLFFTLNKLSFKNKKKLFEKIYNLLKENGYLYIWDVEKQPFKLTNKVVEVGMPDKSIVNFNLNCLNLISKNHSKGIIEELKDYFEIEESIQSKDAFKLVCKRKDVKNE